MATCRACQGSITWARTRNGRGMPLDPIATPEGNVQLVATGSAPIFADVLAGERLAEARAAGTVLYMPHHATCPNWGSRQSRRTRH